jgi:hypothetical protein
VLHPSGDLDRWPHVARAVLLELRLSASAELEALRKLIDARVPPPPFAPGVALDPQQLAEFTEWKRTQPGRFGTYLRLLLGAGAVHPRDAVCHTLEAKGQRRHLALKLADASRGLNADALEGSSDKKRQGLRLAYLTDRRRKLGLIEATVAPALAAVAAWTEGRVAPDARLREALVDERMHQRIQVELLDKLAFPTKVEAKACPSSTP